MVFISKGKSVIVSAIPEDTEEEKKTVELIEEMKSNLHELNETDEEKKKVEEI